MKRIFIIVGIIYQLLLSAGCQKNDNKPQLTDSIVGAWELRLTSAAMNPQVAILPEGNGHILKFSATRYERYEAHQLVRKGLYSIVTDPTVESSVCLLFPVGQFTHRIEYDHDNSSQKQFMQMINKRLVFEAGCYALDGGHRMEYVKISDATDLTD